jgi:hypothetical protein
LAVFAIFRSARAGSFVVSAMRSANPSVLQFVEEKRNLLFSRVAICGTVIGVIHTFTDSLDGLRAAPIIDAAFTVIMLCAYWLNRLGYHQTAKSVALLILNLGFAAYASVLPKEVGVYIFYLPLVAVAASVFDSHHWVLRYFFMTRWPACWRCFFLILASWGPSLFRPAIFPSRTG